MDNGEFGGLRQLPGYSNGLDNFKDARTYDEGRNDGYDEGRNDGFTKGRNRGYDEGHADGWDKAIAAGNVQMLKQMEHTRQHVADKEAMAKQLQEQHKLIGLMAARVDELERENADLKKSNTGLRDVVTALKGANERLQTEVSQLDEKFKARTKEYTDQIWQYNRNMVFMNAVRSTLEELTEGDGPQAKQVREVFAQKYGEHVSNALTRGTIRVSPHTDETLAKTLPKTQRFILDMLGWSKK
jgi:uncharacterized coiled-coil protein SlyX